MSVFLLWVIMEGPTQKIYCRIIPTLPDYIDLEFITPIHMLSKV